MPSSRVARWISPASIVAHSSGAITKGSGIEVPAGLAAVVEQVDGGAQLLELAARAFHALAQPAAGQARMTLRMPCQ